MKPDRSADSSKTQAIWLKRALLTVLLGVAVCAALSFYGDTGATWRALRGFPPLFLAGALALAFLNYVVRFLRWQIYLSALGVRVGSRDSWRVFLSGFIMGMTPGRAGEVIKSVLLREVAGAPVRVTAPVVVVERLSDFLGMVLLASGGSLGLERGRFVLAGMLGVCAAVVALLGWRGLGVRVADFLDRIRFLRRWTALVRELLQSAQQLVRIPLLLGTTGLSVVAWFMECVAFWLVFQGLSSPIGLGRATFTYAFSTLLGAVSMIPGGLGLTEGSLTGLAVLEGVAREIAVAAAVIVRLATFWFAFFLGGVVMYLNRRRFGIAWR
jgi:uncharacterized membrane protein YbhN (UPF0104 family)